MLLKLWRIIVMKKKYQLVIFLLGFLVGIVSMGSAQTTVQPQKGKKDVLAVDARNKFQSVKINFKAVVGDKPFDCRESYDGIGTTNSKMTVTDFRFYVQNVRLVDKKGREILVKLANDGKFQTDSVALIDFENGTGNCTTGTQELNTVINGEVSKGEYTALKFQIGVPENLNHLDPTLQPSPLNISKLMWGWQMGYKFAVIEIKTTGRPNGYVVHLGSTECQTDAASGTTSCGKNNRPEFVFDKFNLTKDIVTVDLKALFAGSNVDINQEKTASGCMSFESDSDCSTIFRNLGLTFSSNPAVRQSFMRAEKSPGNSTQNTE